ncbi:hypothetical protein COB28_01720 [Candidatus Dependentiae bacterium]|nr:MAG: hypothetical protein COB28_01720 [Candidatus Dependentiae bacterium]
MKPEYLHYIGIALSIAIAAIGTGLAQGYASSGIMRAMSRQEMGGDAIRRALMIGLVFIESGAILALVLSFFLLTHEFSVITFPIGLVHCSMGICMGFVTAVMALASGCAVVAAAESIARQPAFSQKILSFMMISQTFIEAPVILAFVLLLIINTNIEESISLAEAIKLSIAASGIAVGAIGPAIAQSYFSAASGRAIGLDRNAYGRIFSFSLLTQAIIETPVIFVLISTLFVIFKVLPPVGTFTTVYSLLPALLVVSVGTSSAAIGVSAVASKSCRLIALDASLYTRIFRTSFIAQAFIESCGIYALVVGLLMILRA